MNLLSQFDVAVLRAARRVLTDLERTAFRAEPEPGDVADQADAGRVAGAAYAADEAVFGVLNAADSFLHDERAAEAVRGYTLPDRADAIAELRAVLEPHAGERERFLTDEGRELEQPAPVDDREAVPE